MSEPPTSPLSTPVAVAVGVGCGRLTAVAVRGLAPAARLRVLSLSLVPVALVYPLARTAVPDKRAILREAGGVAAMGFVAALAVRRDRANQVAAGGWLAHAAFDLIHDPGGGSLIPRWYPALCAGFDVGVAWDLLAKP
ncbi:hypothetical protein [Nocardioides sp. W7]|uniref:hypothetical protein n=1 Tax=Nocardioides sp. W7 TaxID=2931390 RepID=UPI001FD013A5|nr:hypothetical protein [Nocardioides sp. W7]